VDSFCEAEELVLLTPDSEVIVQQLKPARRSTFELDQPAASAQSMHRENGTQSRS